MKTQDCADHGADLGEMTSAGPLTDASGYVGVKTSESRLINARTWWAILVVVGVLLIVVGDLSDLQLGNPDNPFTLYSGLALIMIGFFILLIQLGGNWQVIIKG